MAKTSRAIQASRGQEGQTRLEIRICLQNANLMDLRPYIYRFGGQAFSHFQKMIKQTRQYANILCRILHHLILREMLEMLVRPRKYALGLSFEQFLCFWENLKCKFQFSESVGNSFCNLIIAIWGVLTFSASPCVWFSELCIILHDFLFCLSFSDNKFSKGRIDILANSLHFLVLNVLFWSKSNEHMARLVHSCFLQKFRMKNFLFS